MIANFVRFFVLATLKIVALVFYKMELSWVKGSIQTFDNIRLVAVLNHTSLFEPIFIRNLPWRFLWDIASRGVFPAADITMNRPIVGKFFNLTASKVVPITRKRDDTWSLFMEAISPSSMVMIAPEGRMKRPDGLDKHGRPMTVRGGVSEVICQMQTGRMLLAYSGGLHHVHTPGQWFPRMFRKVYLCIEVIEIADFLGSQQGEAKDLKQSIIKNLERRRDMHCPSR